MVCGSVLASNSTVKSVHISNKRLGWENDHDDNNEDDIEENGMKILPLGLRSLPSMLRDPAIEDQKRN